jgi:tight adherence protein B
MHWLVATLFGISLGGLTYVVFHALHEGADAYTGTYSEDTARQMEDMFLFVPPRRIAEIGWAAGASLFLLSFLALLFAAGAITLQRTILDLLLALAVGVAGLAAPRRIVLLLKARRLRRFNLQLVDTLVSMSNALKAGFSITQAFEAVVKNGENPIAQEFDVFLQQTRVGVSFSEALSNMDQRVGSEDLTLVVMAIEAARKTGGNLTEIFEKISATIRERIRIENRIRTLTAQGRLQGIVVGAMPAIIAVAMTLVRPTMMLPFLHSTAGLATLVAVAALVLCGALMIRKIINIDI